MAQHLKSWSCKYVENCRSSWYYCGGSFKVALYQDGTHSSWRAFKLPRIQADTHSSWQGKIYCRALLRAVVTAAFTWGLQRLPKPATVCQQQISRKPLASSSSPDNAREATVDDQGASLSLRQACDQSAKPNGWRCCICMDCNFAHRTELAIHLVRCPSNHVATFAIGLW